MAYCKRCQCGYVIVYEKMGGAPLQCPECTRFTGFFKEEEYHEPEEKQMPVEAPVEPPAETPAEEQTVEQTVEQTGETPVEETPRKKFVITLETPGGELSIPITEETVVGRNAAGKTYLGNFPDVTREHIIITPRANGITATLTDQGRLGTYVNGVRMIKGSSVVVSNYSEIRLASRAILLVRVKEVEENA